MRRPRVFDLYCCEGGCSVGYLNGGFDPYGLDLFEDYTRKRYPFPAIRGDAISALRCLLAGGRLAFDNGLSLGMEDFDLFSASPPCQHATVATSALRQEGKEYVRLIEPTRELLMQTGKPYVIENVKGADLVNPTELCGCMFGEQGMSALDTDGIRLYLQRARRFESNMHLTAPRPHDHSLHEWVGGSYGGARRDKYEAKFVRKGGYVPSIPVQRELLGINWMTQKGMHQSIPPLYTEHLGKQVIAHLAEGTSRT